MARIRRPTPGCAASDDESYAPPRAPDSRPAVRSSPRKKKPAQSYHARLDSSDLERTDDSKLRLKSPPKSAVSSKQRRLAPLHAAPFGRALPLQPLLLPTRDSTQKDRKERPVSKRLQSPRKQKPFTPPLSDVSGPEESVVGDVEGSIWCGSDASSVSEDELPSPRKFLQFGTETIAAAPRYISGTDGDNLDLSRRLHTVKLNEETGNGQTRRRPEALNLDPIDASRRGSSSDKENFNAILHFSPPRLHSPSKQKQASRPVTPPQSPTKSRLQSPTKTKSKVPSPKLRQSLDAFWNVETVNEWNDQYSPRKVLQSPRKLVLSRQDSSSPTTSSPRKAQQSPTKRTKAEREAKRVFENKKHALAESFLVELDDTITGGQIHKLAASTGGVRFIWSKTLNTTAGRANWRRETTKIPNVDGSTALQHKHHASIELAEKVIADEHRLLNVLAHEFCHLANFMVSGIKDQPHGAQFKAWGRKVTGQFQGRGVQVTTKHSFEIEYRYIWRCSGEECGSEFRRHSKSIDPRRHTCGQCRSKLVQIKPTPRGGAGGNGKDGGFTAFVKLRFASTKAGLPAGSSQKAVMEALGKAYRAEKATGHARSETDTGSGEGHAAADENDDGGMKMLAEGLEVIEIVDD